MSITVLRNAAQPNVMEAIEALEQKN